MSSHRVRRTLKAVLHPRPGRRLPPVLLPENVVSLASAFPLGTGDPGFVELLHRIDEGPIHSGNRTEVFVNGDAAFAAFETAIAAARDEVLLESYILRDDRTGRRVFGALKDAVARNVKVRVLADAVGSFGTRRAFWNEMRASGIELRIFHPLAYFWLQFFRDHRKILVVDRQIAFTGGMNVADEYGSSLHAKGRLWRDTQVKVEGPTAWEMAVVFSEAWNRSGAELFTLPPLQTDEAQGARVLVLDARPGRGYTETASVLAAIVGAARRYVWITTAYFAPRQRAVTILASAARRGVDVRLLLPGISDVPIVRHASHSYFNDLVEGGVRVFEYQAATLHAKSLVADDNVAVVGSSNLDFLSFNNNAECNLVILDETTAGALANAYREDLRHSVEIRRETWRPSFAHRTGDALARCLRPIL